MSKPEVRRSNVFARKDPKHGRDFVIGRTFEDAGGVREFTLWLSREELEDVLDSADDLLEKLKK